jgi:hypothetical protein
MKLKMIFNFIFEEIAMAHRTLIRAGLVIALTGGTAAAQSTTHTLEEKIDTLQRQMLEMQHELDILREQQKTDTEEARKRQAEHTEQVQTVKEQVTEQTLNLLERVKLGGYGSLRFESNSLRNLENTFTFRRFVLTTEAKIAPRLHFYSELEFERFRKRELERSTGPAGSGLLVKQAVGGTNDSEISLEQAWFPSLLQQPAFEDGTLTEFKTENRFVHRITTGLAYRPTPLVGFTLVYQYTWINKGKSLAPVTNFLPAKAKEHDAHALLADMTFGFKKVLCQCEV